MGLRKLYERSCFVLNNRSANSKSKETDSQLHSGPRTFEAGLMGAIQLYLGQSQKLQIFILQMMVLSLLDGRGNTLSY